MIHYYGAENIRFSCAYLFRIKIGDKYLLVKDEQGRNNFQPVGGVYKYTDSSFFDATHAVQCTRFGTNSDLDCDLRIIVSRKYVRKFLHWYKSEEGRETPENLYREFQEEILDRIEGIDPNAFKTIKYKYCGEHIESGRMGEKDMQIRIADIVELIPTPDQTKELLNLMQHESTIYHFATKEEIYECGRVNGNQVQTISPHTFKILSEEEKHLKRNCHYNKIYTCEGNLLPDIPTEENWIKIEKADTNREFTFISYNSIHSKAVWDFCYSNRPPLENLWIDRKNVSENWLKNVEKALQSPNCNKAVLFINKEYLLRSSACFFEASLIVEHQIPHIVVLVDIDARFIRELIKEWIFSDFGRKDKLIVYKKLFHFDDITGHLDCSLFSMNDSPERLLQAYSNL